GQINADCGNLHGVAPLISSLRQLHYGALRRPLEQEPSTPSGLMKLHCGTVLQDERPGKPKTGCLRLLFRTFEMQRWVPDCGNPRHWRERKAGRF
ncbi:hypothetical protein J7394_22690, partial [Ruegeria sp. R13_0]|uniref:hypothetical protein n=1 Tax=Ruegeria sp. R13_0 TaxID=2821099 RepID=UPI001ADA3E3C